MSEELKTYSQAAQQLGAAVNANCTDSYEAQVIKKKVLESYNSWAHSIYDRSFLNWGLWNKKIAREYEKLQFNFSALCPYQDIYSQLLLYYLIRPLIKLKYFNKRLLEIGCGNGIGLKMNSALLRTEYALGIDLVHKLVRNAENNFYSKGLVSYLQADAEALPLGDASFDIITNVESSHLYPRLEYFFSEVGRVLAPGGYFCYADIHTDAKQQAQRLERFVASRKDLQIIQKKNITRLVQASIYRRIIVAEKKFYQMAISLFGSDPEVLNKELASLAQAMGISFLPWWKIWVKTEELRPIAKAARNNQYWGGKKLFFYYLIQKV
ncbi:SAM-dependent methyltransferase [Legionella qingyii]|uniref:SAM-dependent methyltransferase n=1 Tax=Legionella qingyii TaxID=2184757 RepID=A0A317TX32_9GAMM|nr:class I SAM-dependent methyltransferase [Legionella qingyii]PWY53961.1 SAM-dependent methyltransferase [Legionella qingyii]RUR18925.1 class I SAM-dependent methyltransferase [Legionella qingyii]RUR21893.1 class I SAM-dependent methyltransferase [Legionella qingyii]